jgi:MFS family permease
VALRLVDRVGRRPLLLGGLAGMAASLCLFAAAFAFGADSPLLKWVAVGSLTAYVGFFAIGLGPVFWLLIAEIYPLKVRGAAMSLATMANWASNFVVTISFLSLLNAVTGVGAFMLFGFLTLVALGYFWRKAPETKGRSPQEIERDLTSAPAPAEAVMHS